MKLKHLNQEGRKLAIRYHELNDAIQKDNLSPSMLKYYEKERGKIYSKLCSDGMGSLLERFLKG